jgi:hypothetical protein
VDIREAFQSAAFSDGAVQQGFIASLIIRLTAYHIKKQLPKYKAKLACATK